MPQIIHMQSGVIANKPQKAWPLALTVQILTVGFLYLGITRMQRQKELDNYGQRTEGRVTAVYETVSKTVKYRVDYTYMVNNTTYYGRDNVTGEFYRSVHRGETIPITYSTLHPSLARTASSMETWDARWCLGLGCFTIGLGIVLLFIPGQQQK